MRLWLCVSLALLALLSGALAATATASPPAAVAAPAAAVAPAAAAVSSSTPPVATTPAAVVPAAVPAASSSSPPVSVVKRTAAAQATTTTVASPVAAPPAAAAAPAPVASIPKPAPRPIALSSKLASCASECQHGGFCFDGVCQCTLGWEGRFCEQRAKCPRDASGAECGGSARGVCDPSRMRCSCAPGWSGPSCAVRDAHCGGSHCSNRGSCIKGTCFCDPGFAGDKCERTTSCGDVSNPCNGRGLCYDNQCRCYPGFSGEICESLSPRPATLVEAPLCKNNCTGHGVCQFGQCVCLPSYRGDDCSQPAPNAGPCSSDAHCSGHGVCHEGRCSCEEGTWGDRCELGGCAACNATHGVCLKNTCHCRAGWGGADCSTPLTCPGLVSSPDGSTAPCNRHGVCVQGKCRCEQYFSGVACERSEFGDGVCPNKCSGNGVCKNGKCLCAPGRTGADCSKQVWTSCGSGPPPPRKSQPLRVRVGWDGEVEEVPEEDDEDALDITPRSSGPECNGNGECFRTLCVCAPGYEGRWCEKKKACSDECLRNGVCNYGVCLCAPDFTGQHCNISTSIAGALRSQAMALPQPTATSAAVVPAAASSAASLTPTASNVSSSDSFACVAGDRRRCSLHGTCNRDGRCVCDEGFSGARCESLLLSGVYSSRCPNRCSDRGFCHMGRCVCDIGFGGPACEHQQLMPCPADCNGRGVCRFGRCHCPSDWSGEACEVKLRCAADCAAKGQGVCVAGRCVCLNGYTGLDCSHPPQVPLPTPTPAAVVLPANATGSSTLVNVSSNAAAVNASSIGALARFASLDSEDEAHVHAELGAHGKAEGSYRVALHPAVLGVLSFVLGVGVALALSFGWARREEAQRKQQMLKPLLATR